MKKIVDCLFYLIYEKDNRFVTIVNILGVLTLFFIAISSFIRR